MTDPAQVPDVVIEAKPFYTDGSDIYFAAIECERCKARIGDRCRTATGYALSYLPMNCHAVRYKSAPKLSRDAFHVEDRKRRNLPPAPKTRDPARTPDDQAKIMAWALGKMEDDFDAARRALERAIKARKIMLGIDEEGK